MDLKKDAAKKYKKCVCTLRVAAAETHRNMQGSLNEGWRHVA